MTPKIKNIIIFVAIGLVLVLGYVFFLKPAPAEPSLTSSSDAGTSATGGTTASTDQNSAITQDFLSLLLSVKSITLDDSIFATPAFNSLQDSTIVLTPDGTQGRPNPFAPIGTDSSAALPPVPTSGTGTLVAPTQIDTTTPPAKTPAKTTTKTAPVTKITKPASTTK